LFPSLAAITSRRATVADELGYEGLAEAIAVFRSAHPNLRVEHDLLAVRRQV